MLSDKSKLQKEVKGYDEIYQTFKTFAECILFINSHVYKNVQKHAWTLNIPTSGVLNSNMKVRGKDRAFLMFTTLYKILQNIYKIFLYKNITWKIMAKG